MPVLYADEDQAAAVMGTDWQGQYAQTMGMTSTPGMGLTPAQVQARVQQAQARARRWRHGRHRHRGWQRGRHRGLSRGLSDWGYTPPTPQVGALYQAGLGDAVADFKRWSSILDQYTDLIPHINDGSTRETLAHMANALWPVQQSLLRSFGPGASPGISDTAKALEFGFKVKRFRDEVNKGRDKHGMVSQSFPVYLLKGGKKAAKGSNFLLYALLAAGAFAALR